MQCLGEIVRMFNTDLGMQAKRSKQLRETMAHPAFRDALSRPPPKRTRGGTGGNGSIQAIYTWTEFYIVDYDKGHNPDQLPAFYAAPDEYVRAFCIRQKRWETDDGSKSESDHFRHSFDPQTPSRASDEIEGNGCRIIGMAELSAPHVRGGFKSASSLIFLCVIG